MTATLEPQTTSSFIVELDQFSGPLDLLLVLIREEQVEITDIPIARICEQFLARIDRLELSEAAEYLEMAARLLRIKAQMLLPRSQDDEDWDDPRAELVRRLLEYQQMREVVDLLEDRSEERRSRFSRGWTPAEPAAPASPLAVAPRAALGRGSCASRFGAAHAARHRSARTRCRRRNDDHSRLARDARDGAVVGSGRERRGALASTVGAARASRIGSPWRAQAHADATLW